MTCPWRSRTQNSELRCINQIVSQAWYTRNTISRHKGARCHSCRQLVLSTTTMMQCRIMKFRISYNFNNPRFLVEYVDPRGMTWQEAGENCIMRRSIVRTLHHILLAWSNQGGWDGRGMYRAWGWWEIRINFSLKAWREEITRKT
jgi:hypothetical protein